MSSEILNYCIEAKLVTLVIIFVMDLTSANNAKLKESLIISTNAIIQRMYDLCRFLLSHHIQQINLNDKFSKTSTK